MFFESMKKANPEKPIRIRAYFDFMCPWSYLSRVRLKRALHRIQARASIEWMPFELYETSGHHTVERERILGHEHLNKTYAQLHELGLRENILILHPQYEASSRRALTGFLYAQKKGVGEKYLDLVFEQVFEHTSNISSLPVLYKIAVKTGLDPIAFLEFVETAAHQHHVAQLTAQAKKEGVKGLPTYLINHLPVTGALPVNDLVSIIETASKPVLPAYILFPQPKQKKIRKKKKTTKRRPTPLPTKRTPIPRRSTHWKKKK